MKSKQSGVAIILVVFLVALASILVVNLTYSTFLSNRTMGMVERQLQSEYILKSLVNFSQSLIQYDTSKDYDSYQDDIWGIFHTNPRIPNEYLGIHNPNTEIYLEIVPRNSKVNVSYLGRATSGTNSSNTNRHLEAFENLLINLSFDNDLLDEEPYGKYKGRAFLSNEVVANLVDWQDANVDPLDLPNYQGIEDEVDKENVYNDQFSIIGQLSMVPGITPRRLNALSPFIATYGSNSSLSFININTAGDMVLRSLHPSMDDITIENLRLHIEQSGPFKTKTEINDTGLFTTEDFGELSGLIGVYSHSFDVYGKVKYGLQRAYYLKARVKKGRNITDIPKVLSAVYY